MTTKARTSSSEKPARILPSKEDTLTQIISKCPKSWITQTTESLTKPRSQASIITNSLPKPSSLKAVAAAKGINTTASNQ
jgi:hypothetical protein